MFNFFKKKQVVQEEVKTIPCCKRMHLERSAVFGGVIRCKNCGFSLAHTIGMNIKGAWNKEIIKELEETEHNLKVKQFIKEANSIRTKSKKG